MASTVKRERGMEIGVYRVCERLGAGAMGVVYEAERPDGTLVAVKVMDPTHRDDEYRARKFRDEGIAGRIVCHPGVVAVLECGQTPDGIPYIVMERVRGENLGALIRRGELGMSDAIDLACQLLRALHAMHEVGIVHGDVKSENILVEVRPDHGLSLKLVDLGLAKVWLDESEPQTLDSISGTPDYMAPEIILGHGVSPATDIYAASVLLYEMVTGMTPFGGGEGPDILARQLDQVATPPSERVPEIDIPPELDQIVLCGLAKAPKDRHRSAARFADALAALATELRSASLRLPSAFSCDGATEEWVRDDSVGRRWARGTPRGGQLRRTSG